MSAINDNISVILGEELALIAKLSNARNDAISSATFAVLLKAQTNIKNFKPEAGMKIYSLIANGIDLSFDALDLEQVWRNTVQDSLQHYGIKSSADGAELNMLDPVSRTNIGCMAYYSLGKEMMHSLLVDLNKEAVKNAYS